MRAKPILLLCGASVVTVAAVVLVADLSTSTAMDDGEALRQPISETRTGAADQSSVEHRQPARVALRPFTPPTLSTSPAQTPQQRDQQQVARIDAHLGDRLRAEPVDVTWARATETAIASTLAAPSFAGLRIDGVTCGATLCRIALTANEQLDELDAVIEELTSTQPFRHGGFVRFTGERALTMFVARKGHPLPPAPRT